ncbi:MAG: hypothetical protein JW963_05975, partial [Anaerolineales bacterium]|nr:hypothetical protein [Anaerolineales bacterium]
MAFRIIDRQYNKITKRIPENLPILLQSSKTVRKLPWRSTDGRTLTKILSRAGFGSRRSCEKLIAKGRVTVNGQNATLGMKADPQTDRIKVNERPIELDEELVYIA